MRHTNPIESYSPARRAGFKKTAKKLRGRKLSKERRLKSALGMMKITWDQAYEIAQRLKNGERAYRMCHDYGISSQVIDHIKHRRGVYAKIAA